LEGLTAHRGHGSRSAPAESPSHGAGVLPDAWLALGSALLNGTLDPCADARHDDTETVRDRMAILRATEE
jgi:hypothetical protein